MRCGRPAPDEPGLLHSTHYPENSGEINRNEPISPLSLVPRRFVFVHHFHNDGCCCDSQILFQSRWVPESRCGELLAAGTKSSGRKRLPCLYLHQQCHLAGQRVLCKVANRLPYTYLSDCETDRAVCILGLQDPECHIHRLDTRNIQSSVQATCIRIWAASPVCGIHRHLLVHME